MIRSFAKPVALLFCCVGLVACFQAAIIPRERAQQDILTAQQGGECGKGDNLTVTTKDGKKQFLQVCEVSQDYLVGCPTTGGWNAKPAPGVRIALSDVTTILRERNRKPCWARGINGPHDFRL